MKILIIDLQSHTPFKTIGRCSIYGHVLNFLFYFWDHSHHPQLIRLLFSPHHLLSQTKTQYAPFCEIATSSNIFGTNVILTFLLSESISLQVVNKSVFWRFIFDLFSFNQILYEDCGGLGFPWSMDLRADSFAASTGFAISHSLNSAAYFSLASAAFVSHSWNYEIRLFNNHKEDNKWS